MAYERRRVSTESDKSSTSTTHSTESNGTYSTISSNRVYSSIPNDQKSSLISTRKATHLNKRNSTMSSPAEQILARTKNTFVDLNPYFQCSSLPSHWRKNKSLRFILRAKQPLDIKANTRVIILAGNDYNPCATLKNNISWFRDGQAEFNDLRFLGASGRGKKFTLTIIIETTPPQQCTYRRAIKITVDGPRKKRELKPKSDVNETQADESNADGESDNETNAANCSMNTETSTSSSSFNRGSSGLLLLAAAAEKKRRDEEEDESQTRPKQSMPLNITHSSKLSDTNSPVTHCLSPSSSLASQFSQSIAFSPTSSFDDLNNRSIRQVFLPTNILHTTPLTNPTMTTSIVTPTTTMMTTTTTTTTTVPLVSPITSSSNLLLSFASNSNRFDIFPQQRRDQQTMVETSTSTSSTTAKPTTHVLCR